MNTTNTRRGTKELNQEIKKAIRAKPALKTEFEAINRLYNNEIIQNVKTALNIVDGLTKKNKLSNNKALTKLNLILDDEKEQEEINEKNKQVEEDRRRQLEHEQQLAEEREKQMQEEDEQERKWRIHLEEQLIELEEEEARDRQDDGELSILDYINNIKYNNININSTNKFLMLNNFYNNDDNIIYIGGYEKLKNLYNSGARHITANYYKKPIYIRDTNIFNVLLGSHNLNELIQPNSTSKKTHYNKATFKGFKDRLTLYMYQHYGSGAYIGYVELIENQRTTPQQHRQEFRDNINYNCFIKATGEAMKDGQRDKILDERTTRILTELNNKYYTTGAKIKDVETTEKKLNINIIIKNKIGTIIYKNENQKQKRQTILLYTPYIDHIEYIKLSTNKKDKIFIAIEDIETHYNNNNSSFKYFKKDINQKLVYYFDDTNLYYQPFKINDIIVNDDKYFIYDNETYHQEQFINDNNLNFNSIFYNDDKFIFNEINNTPHHINQYIFNDNLTEKYINEYDAPINPYKNPLDEGTPDEDKPTEEHTKQYNISSYHTIDNNKNFIGWQNEDTPANKYYKNFKIPANGRYTAYKIGLLTDAEKEIILNTTSIIKINNIVMINKVIDSIEYFINGNNYTTPILKYCLDNNIIKSFDIELIITFDETQEINFNDDIIKGKFYNKIIGLMHHRQEQITAQFEYKNISDLQDILYYNENIYYNIENKTVSITRPNENISNKAHISSFIMSYAFINILDVLKDINYNNIIAITADAITTKEPIKAIISKQVGQWKEQKKEILITSSIYYYINIKEENQEENKLYELTSDKLLYKTLNFISGEAGTGKTTQFLKAFENDERLYNSLLLLPSNELLFNFNKDHPDINKMTYQNFIKETSDKGHYTYIKKFSYILVDEATMISDKDILKIVLTALKNKQKIFIIGDYSINDNILYQLKPIKDKPFISLFDKDKNFILGDSDGAILKDDIYYKHLTINRRQGTDAKFNKFLKEMRGKHNKYIMTSIINNSMFKKISFDDAIKTYKLGDKFLCTTNKEIDKANNNILIDGDNIQILYLETSKEHAKNETAIIKASDYDPKKHRLGYAQTAHTAQGQTYDNNIYISLNCLFTDNILYVMLSRTRTSKQIYIIV
jgi:hypothetical protein